MTERARSGTRSRRRIALMSSQRRVDGVHFAAIDRAAFYPADDEYGLAIESLLFGRAVSCSFRDAT